jgi:hypothetical protein
VKRIYQKPDADIVLLRPVTILATTTQDGTQLDVNISGYEEEETGYGFSQ